MRSARGARAPRFAYIAPFYRQAKRVAWDYLKHYSRAVPGRRVNETELRVDFPNGARIQLYGADNPDSLRGIYLDGGGARRVRADEPRFVGRGDPPGARRPRGLGDLHRHAQGA